MTSKSPQAYRYSDAFFSLIQEGSHRSAKIILPQVIQWIPCKSVVDVGCGVGTWLRVFKDLGVKEVLGMDGDYVNRRDLQISGEEFLPVDLTEPHELGRQFDLAVSLEVAEHLPPAAADKFVTFLTNLAPAVLFSAAVPGQRGINHLNEQWPEYWADRFERRGFASLDCVRERFWENENVEWWYLQNTFLFVRNDYLAANPVLKSLSASTNSNRRAYVHPRAFLAANWAIQQLETEKPERMGLLSTIRLLPAIFWYSLRRNLKL